MDPGTSFLKTKLAQVVLGAIAFGCFSGIFLYNGDPIILTGGFFYTFLALFAFTLTSLLLLVTSFFEETRESVRSLFELVYHLCGFILLIAAGITLAVILTTDEGRINDTTLRNLYYTTMICTFLNSLAYLLNALLTYTLRNS